MAGAHFTSPPLIKKYLSRMGRLDEFEECLKASAPVQVTATEG